MFYTLKGKIDAIKNTVGRTLQKKVTFANRTTDVTLFTVTGAVKFRLYAVCTTSLASAGGCNIGLKADTVEMITATACTDLVAGDLWFDATPTEAVKAVSNAELSYVIGNGGDIVLDLETAKQVDSGVLEFYLEWTALSENGNVVVA